MDMKNYFGSYYMMGMMLNIQEMDGNLVASMPGVPAGYEIELSPLETEDTFRMKGGPADGSSIQFMKNEEGDVAVLKVGHFDFTKVSDEKAKSLPTSIALLPPDLDLTNEKQTSFQRLLDDALAHPTGNWIDYRLPYPKHEFIRFVMEKDVFIFHGSNNREIEVFEPVRTSVEMYDKTGRGNQQAVYGTHDALWSMFFSVVHRKQLKGTIRNGVMYFHNKQGKQLAVYNFSVSADQLPEKPWTEGALYFLPRDTFERQWLTPESLSNEWTSPTAVKPIAKISIRPEDFPFLDRIGGHDDSVFMRLESLGKSIRGAALSAQLNGAQFQLTMPDSNEMADALKEYIEIQTVLMPASQFNVERSTDGLTFSISNLSPAHQQVYAKTYSDLLGKQ